MPPRKYPREIRVRLYSRMDAERDLLIADGWEQVSYNAFRELSHFLPPDNMIIIGLNGHMLNRDYNSHYLVRSKFPDVSMDEIMVLLGRSCAREDGVPEPEALARIFRESRNREELEASLALESMA